MDSSTAFFIAGAAVAVLLVFLVLFKRITRTFSVNLSVKKDALFEFLKTPSSLQKVHPSIETVQNEREEENRLYFDVDEDLGALAGKKRVTLSLESYTDTSTHKSYIRLQNHDTLVKVFITLVISDYNPLDQLWAASASASLSQSSSSSKSLFSSSALAPSTPTTTTPTGAKLQGHRSTTVQGRVEVTVAWGLTHLIARHLVHVWQTTLSNTDRLLSGETTTTSSS